jgi:hypothetical protein
VTPADAWLDAAERTVSLGARELCCLLNGTTSSFARAADALKRAGGVSISPEKLREVVEAEGRRVLEAKESAESAALLPGWAACDCKVKTPKGRLVSRVYLGADGFMAPLVTDAEKQNRRKNAVRARRRRPSSAPKLPALRARRRGADQRYKEFKAVLFYDQDLQRRLVSVTRGDGAEAGRIMRRDADRIGFGKADERVGNIDGGPWILNQVRRRSMPMTAVGLDFYHLAENVHRSARLTFGEADKTGLDWAARTLHAAKHRGYVALSQRLSDWRGRWRAAAKRKEADRLTHYVSDRREMIDYPRFLANGWRIGSGPTESQCRVVPGRVKRPGKRWDADNAEAVMALEAAHQSDQWRTYWATCAAAS